MVVLAPVIAIYFHTSSVVGPWLAVGSVAIGIGAGVAMFFRNALRSAQAGIQRRAIALPALVLLVVQMAILVQLIALASPILPQHTVFEGGFDHLIGR